MIHEGFRWGAISSPPDEPLLEACRLPRIERSKPEVFADPSFVVERGALSLRRFHEKNGWQLQL
jgi:hypothetical protein